MRRGLAIPILLCGLGLATSCTPSDGAGIPTAEGSASASASASGGPRDLVAFASCLRQHGVDTPDPNPDLDWERLDQDPQWSAASRACAHLGPAPQGQATPSTADLERIRSFAVCMRQHGIEMTDPDATGNTRITGRLADVSRAELNNDPGFKAAYGACRDKLPPEQEKPR